MRVAWFSPWPPQPSGVAGRSNEVVAALAGLGHGFDVFVDETLVPCRPVPSSAPPAAGDVRVQSAHEFVWRTSREPYDLVVYQVGNSRLHEFIWPYLFRWPGLAVLHDSRLHHARARASLSRRHFDAYRAEFAWSQGAASADAAELGIRGFDGPYYYLWPMTRGVVEASRLVASHARGSVNALSRDWPGREFEYIALGEGRQTPVGADVRASVRQAIGAREDAVLFGVFGALTVEKRILQILRAFKTTAARTPSHHIHLILGGAADPRVDVHGIIRDLGIGHATTVLADLDDDAFDRAIAAVDVSVNLRWPTTGETSGPWLRALAAGRATIVTDLAHQAETPTLDPRSWRPRGSGGEAPVAIAVDILDEEHSLRLAMQRLASDPALRERIGDAGRRYWEAHHSIDRMVRDYVRVMDRAASLPTPASDLAAVLRPDATAHTRALLAPFGDVSCELF